MLACTQFAAPIFPSKNHPQLALRKGARMPVSTLERESTYIASPLLCEECCSMAVDQRSRWLKCFREFFRVAVEVAYLLASYVAIAISAITFLLAAVFPTLFRSQEDHPGVLERKNMERAKDAMSSEAALAQCELSKLHADQGLLTAHETGEESYLASAWSSLGAKPCRNLADVAVDRQEMRQLAIESERAQRDNLRRAERRQKLLKEAEFLTTCAERARDRAEKAAFAGDGEWKERYLQEEDQYHRQLNGVINTLSCI
jgi:hypothetical protein